MTTPPAQGPEIISFGPFSLVAGERLLTRDGVPVELSTRALDILMVLLSRPSEVISKNELLTRAWPGITVEEGNLRFQITNLRKALGDGKDGARYITTSAGRGYCFVAQVSRGSAPVTAPAEIATSFRRANLPVRLGGMVGREEDLEKLSKRLNTERFVTIVGAGGVGKTTIAIAVAHLVSAAFAGAVLFVDLGMLNDSSLVPTAVASMLGLSVQSTDATTSLVAYLRDKKLLLILDTCEHLIDAVAALAAAIFSGAPQVHLLATSRETLQVEGEHIYRLEPLACAPDDPGLSAEAVRTFPATQLFVQRAIASGARLDLNDSDAAIVVSICRKLDGVALAIELAARRVEAYGLRQTAALLDQRLAHLWAGSRTAPPRQKTLQATLDWSCSLLSETERLVLRRLAIFAGHFTLDAALAVTVGETLDQPMVFDAIDSLVGKSMVSTRPVGAMMRYRLLDTTRAYALDIRIGETEAADLAIRHATYYRQWLEQSLTEWSNLTSGSQQASDFAGLNNARAALEWCFGDDGNVNTGVGLAAAAAPVFLMMSLLPECHRWSERALSALDDDRRGGVEELHLQAGLGISSMHLFGETDAVRSALSRGLAIAEERGRAVDQAGLLGFLHMFHFRGGHFKTAMQYARQCRAIAATVENSAAMALAHSILGRSLHLAGELNEARGELETSLELWSRTQQTTIYLAFDRHYRAGIALARTLWLQGYPNQAVECAREAIERAEHSDLHQPTSLAVASLAWAASIFLWTGDYREAEKCINNSISHAERNSLGPLSAVGQARRAELSIHQGRANEGVEQLRSALGLIHSVRYELLTTEFNLSLVRGLTAIGEFAEAFSLIDATADAVETNGDSSYTPELLRLKATLLQSTPEPRADETERLLTRSLEISRTQGARSWELRAATDLAALLADRGEQERARTILEPVFARFTEGFDTADLQAAKRLLTSLS
jgi:predicted ATPase/DNA-binding winged helix-turn-helix (wHTH) protein